jgi:DNA mismatch repair protein PMS2
LQNSENQQLLPSVANHCSSPRPIELTASEEMVAIDNLDILKANGFDIQIDEDAPPTQKMKIISQPVSKNVMFNTKGRH